MAVIDGDQIVDTFKSKEVSVDDLEAVLAAYPHVKAAMMISARGEQAVLETFLQSRLKRYLRFDHSVSLPIGNLYETPETLGPDRLAAAVGANALYPETNVLIVDFGTAITIDMVSERNEYLGGNISPGAATRFRALHEFTQKLPHCALTEKTKLLGSNSLEAIESGVINGIVYEIEGYIERLKQKYSDLRIIFTGGEGNFFAKRLKNPIFATYDLVAYGLNRILEYHAE